MAKVILSSLFTGLRGRVGNVVDRRINGETHVSAVPRPSTKPPSPAQLAARERFAAASRARAAAKIAEARNEWFYGPPDQKSGPADFFPGTVTGKERDK